MPATPPPAALGGRLPLLAPHALDPAQQAVYEQITTTIVPKATHAGYTTQLEDGRLIGPFNALLYSPKLATGFLAYSAVEARQSSLTGRVRQLIILAVGAVWRSPYELYAHVAEAKQVGFSDDAIHEFVQGRLALELSPNEQTAYLFAHQLTSQHRVEEVLYQQAASAFGPLGLADVILLTARYHMTCVLLNGFDIPAPAH